MYSVITNWAKELPQIKRVWLFGSRAKGTATPDSDIDLAIELDPSCIDGDTPQIYWMCEAETMLSTLQTLIPYEIDLQLYELRIVSFVSAGSICLYEKTSKQAKDEF